MLIGNDVELFRRLFCILNKSSMKYTGFQIILSASFSQLLSQKFFRVGLSWKIVRAIALW